MKLRHTLPGWPTLTAIGLLWVPRLAEACAVCSAGRDDETRLAFLLTTLLLSVLPLGLIGGFVFWLVRRSRALDRNTLAAHPGAPLLRTSSSQ